MENRNQSEYRVVEPRRNGYIYKSLLLRRFKVNKKVLRKKVGMNNGRLGLSGAEDIVRGCITKEVIFVPSQRACLLLATL